MNTWYDSSGNPVFISMQATDGSSDLHYYNSGSFYGVSYTSYDVHYSPSGAAASETFYDANGATLGSETFTANGGVSIMLGGSLYFVDTVYADGSKDARTYVAGTKFGASYASYDVHYNAAGAFDQETWYDASNHAVLGYGHLSDGAFDWRYYDGGTYSGKAYTSLQDDYDAASKLLGVSYDNSDGSGVVNVTANNVTVTVGGNALSLTSGSDTILHTAHSSEAIQLGAASNDIVTLNLGFGNVLVSGFDATDVIHFGTLFSSYAQIQGAMTTSNGNTIISDGKGDTLTIAGVTPSQMNAARFGY